MSTSTSPVASCAIARVVDLQLITRLQCLRSEPSVSVLLSTTPGASLAGPDFARLQRLLDTAERRLRLEPTCGVVERIMDRLHAIAIDARSLPAGRALALFASAAHAEAVQLAVQVEERVVVDPTFATRDLLRSLIACPRYRLLVLAQGGTRLFEGRPDRIEEITQDGFPVTDIETENRNDRSKRFGRDRSDARDAAFRNQIRAIDQALAVRRSREPLPVVIAGGPRQLALFRNVSSEKQSVIGEIAGNHGRTPASRLASVAVPTIERHRQAQLHTAVARLHAGHDRGRVVSGISAVWAAAIDHRIGLLCVEDGYVMPARVSMGGRRLHPATHADEPGVLDDSVDELIELVLLDGGDVALLEDGALGARQPVAALLL